uniref:Variant surface glycoprotein n=1 Tax=Trypanosoma brucei TaxID=5691 RepID=A0A1V0FY31_9TRYP|nr:variant surface glycoprotein [Trypanosoma brucei]
MRWIGISLVFVIMATADFGGSTTGDAAQDKLQTACQEAVFAAAVAHTYEARAVEAESAYRQIDKQALIWNLEAQTEIKHERSALLAALSASATAVAAETEKKGKEKAAKLRQAAQAFAQRAEALQTAYKMAAPTYAANSNPFTAPANTGYTITSGATQEGQSACDDDAKKVDGKQPQPKAFGTTALKKLKLTKASELHTLLKKASVSVTAAGNNCARADSATNSITSCTGNIGAGTAFKLAAQKEPQPPETSIFDSDDRQKGCAEKLASEDDKKDTTKVFLNTICLAELHTTKDLPKLADIIPSSLAADDSVIAAIRNADTAFSNIKDVSDGTKDSELVKYVTKTYGQTPEKFTDEFITKMNKQPLKYRASKEMTTSTLEELATKKEAGTAISFYHAQQQRKRTEEDSTKEKEATDKKEEKKDGNSKAKVVNCTSHATHDGCSKGKNCK